MIGRPRNWLTTSYAEVGVRLQYEWDQMISRKRMFECETIVDNLNVKTNVQGEANHPTLWLQRETFRMRFRMTYL